MNQSPKLGRGTLIAVIGLSVCVIRGGELQKSESQPVATVRGLTGRVADIVIETPASERVDALTAAHPSHDVDLQRMGAWAMNYLMRTPRPELEYEPVFQCHPLRCPPTPSRSDPIVACDTDARLDWEWYYMREVSGSDAGQAIEAAFHQRMRNYVDAEGRVWSHPGCYNEGQPTAQYEKKDEIIHVWGATKILKSLSEDFARTRNPESKELAGKVLGALRKLATWDDRGRCWLPAGMGALRADGTIVPNAWNVQPAPLVEPLVTYWLATHDQEGLDFARAYAEGMIENLQPSGIRFQSDGSVTGGFGFGPHSHATMHAVWGVAHLGVVTGEKRYTEFARGVFEWLLKRGTGTGWFPAGPDNCNETCCVSDMMSIAALVGQAGHPEYYDYVERYLRNYISNLQFVVTPEFEAYYRTLNTAQGEEPIRQGLEELRKFQGGIIGGSGLNDFENELLGGVSGFEMFGCCAPEGMRAIYTTWTNTIDRRPESPWSVAGIYVNMSFSRHSPWGTIVSFLPEQGQLSVRAAVKDVFFIRPPHWAPRRQVRAFVGTKAVPVTWAGDYVRFDAAPGDELTITYPLIRFTHKVKGLWGATPDLEMTFQWLGNMVVSVTPAAGKTPLFTGKPRILPDPPTEVARTGG